MHKIITVLFISLSITTNAQFLKRLKAKVSEKINNVVDQKINNEIDKIIDTKKGPENDSNTNPKKVNAKGNCIIEHNNSLGTININNLADFRVVVSHNQLEITGFWQTHEIDVADNFYLIIKDDNASGNDVNYFSSKNYKLYKNENDIPTKGAYLKLGYNPELNNNPKAQYQNYIINGGSINIEAINDHKLKFSADGVPFDEYKSTKNLATNVKANIDVTNINLTYKTNTSSTVKKNKNQTNSIDLKKYGIDEMSTINKKYTFDTQINFEINDGKQTNNMTLLTSNNNYSAMKMVMDEGTIISITDKESNINLLENDGQKMQIPVNKAFQNNYQNELLKNYQEEANFVKTGKRKTILGFKCTEFSIENNNTKTVLWITEELNISNSPFSNSHGTILESTYTQNNKKFTSKVVNIQHKIININTQDYKNIMNMF